MESKDELKKIDIKNCKYYYFDDLMRVIEIDFSDILLDEKPYEKYKNIFIYYISSKTFMGVKPLCIWFKKVDGFIKTYDGITYLVSFVSERYNAIFDRTDYLISEKK